MEIRAGHYLTYGFLGVLLSYSLQACSKDTSTNSEQTISLSEIPGSIVFATDRNSNWDIYLTTFSGGNHINLTPNSSSDDSYPIWVNNGNKIIFASNRDGNFNLYIIHDVADPENSIEQLTDSDGDDTFPELSPSGDFLLYFNNGGASTKRLYKYEFSTGQSTLINEERAPAQIRFVSNNKALTAQLHGVLMEFDLQAGMTEKYVYSYDDFDEVGVVTAFDVSKKTGLAYASLNSLSIRLFYNFWSWDFEARSDYYRWTGGPIQNQDIMRCFRVLDIGSPGDYILQSTKGSTGDWKVALGIGEGAAGISGSKSINGQSGDSLYADWTMVEHITPF